VLCFIANTYFTNNILQSILGKQASEPKLPFDIAVKGKGKGKVHPRTGHKGPEGE
jgi:hypothetical protein